MAWYVAYNLSWLALGFTLFLHRTVYAFLLNGFHELCHSTVFKSKKLNVFFLNTVSFLGGYNPVMFWASHLEHHKYTLHPPDDLEVVLPIEITLKSFLKYSFINPWGFVERIKKLSQRMSMCLRCLRRCVVLCNQPHQHPRHRIRGMPNRILLLPQIALGVG